MEFEAPPAAAKATIIASNAARSRLMVSLSIVFLQDVRKLTIRENSKEKRKISLKI